MLPLLETLVAFSAIMLVLAFLVKSLTSVVKNHFDFYGENLAHEVFSLVEGTIGRKWTELREDPQLIEKAPWLAMNWKRLGEEYLNEDNMRWVLTQLGADAPSLENLTGRLRVHLENVRYLFGRRMKNLCLVVGFVLCMGLNINAFCIWRTLYSDQEVRSLFTGPYAERAVNLFEMEGQQATELRESGSAEDVQNAREGPSRAALDAEREHLEQQTELLRTQLQAFMEDLAFGVGHIWTETPAKGEEVHFFLVEFLGSLLTGILVSIGAPYWHDLLRTLTRTREPRAPVESVQAVRATTGFAAPRVKESTGHTSVAADESSKTVLAALDARTSGAGAAADFGRAGKRTVRTDIAGAELRRTGGESVSFRITDQGESADFTFACQHRTLCNAKGFDNHPSKIYEWTWSPEDADAPSDTYGVRVSFAAASDYTLLIKHHRADGSAQTLKDIDYHSTEPNDAFQEPLHFVIV